MTRKKTSTAASALILSAFALCPSVAQAQEPTANNTIYLEGGGPGGFYSINFERRISDFGVRVGFSYFSNSNFKVTSFPLGFNYIGVGGQSSHLELGATATLAIFEGTGLFTDGTSTVAVLGSGIIGYRYQPADGGFNFRIGAAPLLGNFGLQPWGYISFGGTFGGGAHREPARNGEYAPPPSSAQPPVQAAPQQATPTLSRPTGIGGFRFKMGADDARSSCEASGNQFEDSPNIAHCSGPAESVGVEGDIQLLKCGDEFCQILFTAEPKESELIADIKALKQALTGRYGKPTTVNAAIPQVCRNTFLTCLDDHRVYLEYIWSFPSGEKIKLRLGDKHPKPKVVAPTSQDPGEESQENQPSGPQADSETQTASASDNGDTKADVSTTENKSAPAEAEGEAEAEAEGEEAEVAEEAEAKESEAEKERGMERKIRLLYIRPAPPTSKKPAL